MKILTIVLLSLSAISCEVPPPYQTRGFRPSQPFLLPSRFTQPQTVYGPPKLQNGPAIPQRQYGVPNTPDTEPIEALARPLSSYFPQKSNYPSKFSSQANLRIVNSQPQVTYGVPTKQELPRIQYGAPYNNYPSSGSNFQQPQAQYGPPDMTNIETFDRDRQVQSEVQKIQELSGQLPTVQYLPVREAAAFKGPENRQNFEQRLPIREPVNFKTVVLQPSEQYLPVKAAGNFRQSGDVSSNYPTLQTTGGHPENNLSLPKKVHFLNNFDVTPYQVPNEKSDDSVSKFRLNSNSAGSNIAQSGNQNIDIHQVEVKTWSSGSKESNNLAINRQTANAGGFRSQSESERDTEGYLPPTTTVKSVLRMPSRPSSVPATTQTPVEDEEKTSETDEPSGTPNIAVATAVAGGTEGQQFYLLQPDGRLQRVLYQKSREEGDQEYEYTANYQFQNIQADPNIAYTPLITLG